MLKLTSRGLKKAMDETMPASFAATGTYLGKTIADNGRSRLIDTALIAGGVLLAGLTDGPFKVSVGVGVASGAFWSLITRK